MVRALIFLGVLGIAAFVAGWISIDRNAEETTIRFNRDEIRQDTSKALAKGRELLNKGRDSVNEANSQGQQQPAQPYPSQQYSNYPASQPARTQQYGTHSYPAPAGSQTQNGYAAPQQATRPPQPWEQSAPPLPQY